VHGDPAASRLVVLNAHRGLGYDDEIHRLLGAETVPYGQPALNAYQPLAIHQVQQFTGILLRNQVSCPADEYAPDLAAGLDQPPVRGGVFTRERSQVGCKIRGERAFRLGGRVGQVFSIRTNKRETSPA
jgi:hypothetical protein